MRFVHIRLGLRLLADTLAPIGISRLVWLTLPCETCTVNIGWDARGGVKARSATGDDAW
jgi:hypothetical protein